MLELIAEKQGPQHCCEELQESEEQKAQRLVGEVFAKRFRDRDYLRSSFTSLTSIAS